MALALLGMRLRYAEWGDGEYTLLLLHDVAEAAAVWAPVAQRLADRGFRVVAYDLRGTCHSLPVEQRKKLVGLCTGASSARSAP